jgi:SAM-dependent methyltransferase
MDMHRTTGGCLLCEEQAVGFARTQGRDYWRCVGCGLVFLDPSQRLSVEAERAYYGTHRNDPDDPGYRRFLARLVQPLLERLDRPSHGLDFGCGPGSALAAMLDEAGHAIALYDPIFAPDASTLGAEYDFIACSEVLEHLHQPLVELERLSGLLRPGGLLAVMTGFPPDSPAAFAGWHYARDPTHVAFYGPQTFDWMARRLGMALEIPDRNVALLRRS